MIYTYDYDRSYNPSAPVVEIKIGRSFRLPSLDLIAMIDSGADSVIIPIQQLRKVKARRERSVWMRTVTGSRGAVDLYSISLQFGPFAFHDQLVVGGLQPEEIVIGRNILNHFIVTLVAWQVLYKSRNSQINLFPPCRLPV